MVYKLRLLTLNCYLPDEHDGDEIFILMNGNKIWPSEKYTTVVEKETRLDLSFEIKKGDRLEFELWDYDTFSKNDLLGRLTLEASAHGNYLVDFIKTGEDTSRYGLEYELG